MICIHINPTRRNLLISSLIFSFFISFYFVTPVIANFKENVLNDYNEINIKFENDIQSDEIEIQETEYSQSLLNEHELENNENQKVTKTLQNEDDNSNNKQENTSNSNNWRLIIEKIQLNAAVAEGTSQELLNQYIGHFENTSILQGTVGLCAHNRGYKVNYFERLNELEIGDEIQYFTEIGAKNYNVIEQKIIKNDDWSDFEQNENKNILILITCVDNEPDLRRIIICLEKEGV